MYEQMRSAFVAALAGVMDADDVQRVACALDAVMQRYDVTEKQVGIIPIGGGLPEVAKIYLASRGVEGLARASMKLYRTVLASFFGSIRKPLAGITTNDIRVWLYSYQQQHGVSLRTMKTYRTIICTFFGWAMAEEYIPGNSCAKIKPIKCTVRPRVAMSQLELEQIRQVCRTDKERAIVEILYSTGCRVAELAGMQLGDIDWSKGTVQVLGKGGKYRTCYLNAKSIVALRRYIESRGDDSQSVIVRDRAPHTGVTVEGLEYIVRRISDRAEKTTGKHITPHIFRHTTATQALRNGMPVQDVQRMLGHANIATTMIYAEVDTTEVEAEHRKRVI